MTANKEVPYAAFGARLMELRKNANMTRAESTVVICKILDVKEAK